MNFRGFEITQDHISQYGETAIRREIHAMKATPEIADKVEYLMRSNTKLTYDTGSVLLCILGVQTVPVSSSAPLDYLNDLPDVDIDFSDTKRHLVFEYMSKTYGHERVAKLGSVAVYKPKSVIKDAATALDIPPWKTTAVLDSLIKTSSGDARALQAIEDTLEKTEAGKKLVAEYPEINIARRMEGHPKNSSTHAAGLLLTDRPIKEYVATDSRTGTVHCDKKDAEILNLLKIDALGLTQLSVFEDTLELAGLPLDHLDKIPHDDPLAFKVLNDKKFSGIFQFEGDALQRVTSDINVNHINDLFTITALARPGPLSGGAAAIWVRRHNGQEPVKHAHPIFEEYLGDTLGMIVFQEQIMRIVRELGGLSWKDVTTLRKAMSKSLGREFFDQFGNPFKESICGKGVGRDVANKIWDDLCNFGAYGFNRSHSVAYGIISYQCCWLKAHYPLEFAAATLTHKKEIGAQLVALRELASEGIPYIAADVDLSTDCWRVATLDGRKTLIGPVQNVVGIGPKLVQGIVSARARNEPLPARAAKLLTNPVTKIDSLFPIQNAFNRIMPNPMERNIMTLPVKINDVQTTGSEYPVLVFCTPAKINPKDENEDINVKKRGGKVLSGPHLTLGMHLADDSGSIYAKIGRFDYEKIAKTVIDRGRPGKSLYAIKGTVPKDFRMITVQMVRYIGDMDHRFQEKADQELAERNRLLKLAEDELELAKQELAEAEKKAREEQAENND